MSDDLFLKPALDLYRQRLLEESRLGWPTLLIGAFVYIAWIFFTEPSFSLAMIGLALMWVMRLLHEMRKIQLMNAATVDFIVSQNHKALEMLLKQERLKKDQ